MCLFWGGSHDQYIPSCQFDNLVSQAHQHILNAQIAGEQSLGRTTSTTQLPSFSPDRAETVLSKKGLFFFFFKEINKVMEADREPRLEENFSVC